MLIIIFIAIYCVKKKDLDIEYNWHLKIKSNEQFLFPIHPDIVDVLTKKNQSKLLFDCIYQCKAIPTSSPRTLFVEDNSNFYFIKLDYPKTLGRFTCDLNNTKLVIGVKISEFLTKISDCHDSIYFFPEVAYIQASILNNQKSSGALIRKFSISNGSKNIEISYPLLPAFSLFGIDYFEPEKLPYIISELINITNKEAHIWNNYFLPLLESYWMLSLHYGLIPEPHSQNFIFSKRDSKPIVIWRDFQGFYRDEIFTYATLNDDINYHFLKRDEIQKAKTIRSFLYDWYLGHYFFDQFLNIIENYFSINRAFLIERIKDYTNSKVKNIDYFPDNCWYSMSLERPLKSRLEFIENKSLKYR